MAQVADQQNVRSESPSHVTPDWRTSPSILAASPSLALPQPDTSSASNDATKIALVFDGVDHGVAFLSECN